MALLTVTDLTVARGGIAIVEGISFAIEPYSALILGGRNGAGKTSLLRTIAGLQHHDHGHVDVSLDQLAYSSHSDGLKSALSVTENLWFWADIFGQSDIDHALGAMNLYDLRHRPAARLSAGQRRRLGLARLLVSRRKLWIMDEPTVSLDKDSVDLVRNLLNDHLNSGGGALIATHLDMGITASGLNLEQYRAKARISNDGFDAAEGFL